MQRLRDEPECANEEQAARLDETDPGLCWRLGFEPDEDIAAPMIATGARPRVADAARAGRQQPGRDGGGLRPRRLRAGRPAHDRRDRSRRIARGIPGAGRLRRIQLRRRAGSGRGLGEVDPVQCPRARGVRALVRGRRPPDARRLQRLPDAGRARRADSGHGRLAALPAQPLGAVRRAAVAGRNRQDGFAVLRRHGGIRVADRRRAWRGARGIPRRGAAGGGGSPGRAAIRGRRRPAARRAIRRIPMDRPAASPDSPRPAAASRS